MKTKPILFSAPMVQALLAGRKTQTRLVVKPQPEGSPVSPHKAEKPWLSGDGKWRWMHGVVCREDTARTCPYGQIGDLLWVRERIGRRPASFLGIEATNGVESAYFFADGEDVVDDHDFSLCPWWIRKSLPSIHMPRWASRITLEITDVRVERLQGISEDDAKAEGCFFTDYGRDCWHRGGPPQDVGDCMEPAITHNQRPGWMWYKTGSHKQCFNSARFAYANLWEMINDPESWDSNPWVWVIEFKVHQCNVDQFMRGELPCN